MTGLITRKDEVHQGLVQHLKRFKGRENQKMIMIRAKGRMLRHSVWWSNRGSYGSVWTEASKRDTATSPSAWTPTETGWFFLVFLGLAFPR
jgi:hypothetical protein